MGPSAVKISKIVLVQVHVSRFDTQVHHEDGSFYTAATTDNDHVNNPREIAVWLAESLANYHRVELDNQLGETFTSPLGGEAEKNA
jgi:hypothetical protein